MSTAKLKETRDQIVNAGVGMYLPVMKQLVAAIDEHIGEDDSVTSVGTVTVDVTQVPALQKQISDAHDLIAELQSQHTLEIEKLQAELAEAKSAIPAHTSAAAEQPKEEHHHLL